MSGYIGNIPVPQATQTRDVFTASAGQTSFATSGYTPNFVDVYLNGVKLVDGTDFTATNGSDVVLTSGAAASDIVEVLSYSTFEVNSQTFTGSSTFTGDVLIADKLVHDGDTNTAIRFPAADTVTVETAGSERVKVDSSGNVLCGSDGGGDIGSSTKRFKDLYLSGSAYTPVVQGLGDEAGLTFGGALIAPRKNNAAANGTVDLGASSARFKDLYLSGGVYLGGTGSANKLDDYEEGTWTPTVVTATGTPTYQYQEGHYIKIGQYCFATGIIGITNSSSLTGVIKVGMPFTSAGISFGQGAGNGSDGQGFTWPINNTYNINFLVGNTDNTAQVINVGSTSPQAISYNSSGVANTWYFRFQVTYYTA